MDGQLLLVWSNKDVPETFLHIHLRIHVFNVDIPFTHFIYLHIVITHFYIQFTHCIYTLHLFKIPFMQSVCLFY